MSGADTATIEDRVTKTLEDWISGAAPTYSRIIGGAQERLRPILLTAGATFAGVLPLLIAEPLSSPGFELAVGPGAGLVSGTTHTLILFPVAVSFVTRSILMDRSVSRSVSRSVLSRRAPQA